jgi:hypothetical protein
MALVVWCSISVAEESIKVQQIHFAKGKSSATVKGSIAGYNTVDYKLGAKAGQKRSLGNISYSFTWFFYESRDLSIAFRSPMDGSRKCQ